MDQETIYFSMIERAKYLRKELKAVVGPVLKRNAYYAHSEHVLLSMLFDTHKHVRTLASKIIINLRRNNGNLRSLRKFMVPEINLNAGEYISMIDWLHCDRSEPPCTVDFTDEEIEQLCKENSPIK